MPAGAQGIGDSTPSLDYPTTASKTDSLYDPKSPGNNSDSIFVKYIAQLDEMARIEKYKSEKKSVAAALLWSMFIPGAGHFYLDEDKTGALYLVGIIGSALLSGGDHPNPRDPPTDMESAFYLVYVTGYLANIIHAPISANAYNRKIKEKYGLIWSVVPRKNSLALNVIF
jgi:hypothetical protein